ncbi:hypothetical protein HGRIS_002936 [Hohenbuehelia grisea]|uniref:LysM domain-containing protein n=1 Tax=Hohenbuehelia grisea TaxID=104357 RepID=A0ABR3JLZ5_9AGAR
MLDNGPGGSVLTLRNAPSSVRLASEPSSSSSVGNKTPTDERYFTSAIDPSRRSRLRRRPSGSSRYTPDEGGDAEYSWLDSLTRHGRGHSRSKTDASTGGQHPLFSATVGRSYADAGNTRPHLSRLLDWPNGARKSAEFEDDLEPSLSPSRDHHAETDVLVHEVSKTDSLAGVALKYGIHLTDLRKANQLWSSDSIHLRKVLYIPLAKMYGPNAATFRALARRQAEEASEDSDHDSATLTTPSDSVKSPQSVIKRVPVAQLSFFPPPSGPSYGSVLKDIGDPDVHLANALPIFSNHHTRSSTVPASFTNFLAVLPIAASTRDTIISRLSLDSSRSSTSDDQEHELAVVRDRDRDPFTTPRLPEHVPKKLSSPMNARQSPLRRPAQRRTSSAGQLPRDAMRTSIVAGQPLAVSPRPATIRTVQMEPSPAMQLPMVRSISNRTSVHDSS